MSRALSHPNAPRRADCVQAVIVHVVRLQLGSVFQSVRTYTLRGYRISINGKFNYTLKNFPWIIF